MIRALLVCLALCGTARAETPICPANTNEAWSRWMVDHPHACSCASAGGNGGTRWHSATCPDDSSSDPTPPDDVTPTDGYWGPSSDGDDIIARLTRIEALVRAICEHSGAICPKEK